MMMMHDKDFREEMDRLFNEYLDGDKDAETFCTECPFHKDCHTSGRCFACGVWEDIQGDDL